MFESKISDDYDDRPIPDSVPIGTLAYRWCQHSGNREAIHYSFKRWSFPGDYDEDELNRAIDESLAKYPEALRAFLERKKDVEDDGNLMCSYPAEDPTRTDDSDSSASQPNSQQYRPLNTY